MRILIHVISLGAKEDCRAVLRQDPVISSLFDVDSGRFEVDSDSEAFLRILDLTRNTSGFPWTPVVSYSKAEEKLVDHFQVWGRRLIRETDKDAEINIEVLRRTEFLRTGDVLRIKLLSPIHLSKIDLKPNMVAGVGHWAEEYVVGRAVLEAFSSCGLSGYELRPVIRTKDRKPFEDSFQLYTYKVLPPAITDITTIEISSRFEDREWWRRNLGSLTYEPGAILEKGDFFRTAEPWASNDLPLWIVSRRVVECFSGAKLKGWSFIPVLQKGSVLYAEYIEKWKRVFELLAENPQNRVQ